MTRRTLIPAALVLAAALAGCSSDPEPAAAPPSSAPAARTVAGTLMLDDPDGYSWTATTGCRGKGGYDDVSPGAQIVVTDSAGATIGLGKLGDGILETGPGATVPDGCKFTFTIPAVPTGKGFYGVEISKRGKVQYPEAQMFGALALTLG
ncbi:hypothetical protein ABT023_16195 [Micromonospora sp. NPDC002296]|uniref:hypothetical protein n=1 Tax=Micromonospora sp. NPDC002296 TaxID=3154271 RepID=UPI003320A696